MVKKDKFAFTIRANTLSFDDQRSRFYALNDWFNTPQGRYVGRAFAAELAHLQEFLYGETLLQLGHCGDNCWLSGLHYSHKWFATPYLTLSATTLVTSLTTLPFDRNSVDCVIAPLALEAFTHKKNPIDEIDRILKPMGYAIFFGINPMSFWGAFLRFGKRNCFGSLSGQLRSVFFLKRTMLHRGYIQCNLSGFYYIPPVTKQGWIQKLEIFNEVGKMISPCPAGFYCLVVQKYQENCPNLLVNHRQKEPADARSRSMQPACQLKQDK